MEMKGRGNVCEGAGIGKPKRERETERDEERKREYEKLQHSNKNVVLPERHRKCFNARQMLPNL